MQREHVSSILWKYHGDEIIEFRFGNEILSKWCNEIKLWCTELECQCIKMMDFGIKLNRHNFKYLIEQRNCLQYPNAVIKFIVLLGKISILIIMSIVA